MTPPQHSVTATISHVSAVAFDTERVKAERAVMVDGDSHPVVLFVAGESRGDLDAKYLVGDVQASAREYLKPDHGCPIWTARRMRSIDVARCRDMGPSVGRLEAFRLAYASCDGREFKPSDKPISESQVEAMADVVGVTELCEAGEAFLRASEAPKAAEKKP